ncbi:MAG: type III secretion system chaperone, partial [Pseudomonadota bacterium]
MHAAPHDARDWGPVLQQLARDLDIRDYSAGALWFAMDGGPPIVVEPLTDASVLAIHANLGAASPERHGDGDAPYARMLAANGRAGSDGLLYGVDPLNQTPILYQRLEDAAAWSYSDFVSQLREFADGARRAADGSALEGNDDIRADLSGLTVIHEDAFHSLWADFLFERGLAALCERPSEPTGGLIALDDGGWLLVHHEAESGMVLLETVVGTLPDRDEKVFRELLEAHLLGEATDGACFALEPDDSTVVAFRRLPLQGLDATTLGAALDGLGITAARFGAALGLA